jgi:transposase
MARPTRFSPEVRAQAVRMVVEHDTAHDSQWATITSIRREDRLHR